MRIRESALLVALLSLVLVGVACASETDRTADVGEMQAAPGSGENPLYVEPGTDPAAHAELMRALAGGSPPTRELYEPYLDRLGSNGILDVIEARAPKCHSEAHDLGRVIHARLGAIGPSLRACAGRCYSGCMHGVLMDAFAGFCGSDGELHFELLAPAVNNLCSTNAEMLAAYSPGDCAHGVGHALMFLADYGIPRALGGCDTFRDSRLRYYCATGAYMEYMGELDDAEAVERSFFHPCDTQRYPAACARYQLVHALRRELASGGRPSRVIGYCRGLEDPRLRRACFHGLGNAFMPWIARGKLPLDAVCARTGPAEAELCVEGAIERMAKYDPDRARRVCEDVESANRPACDAARRFAMYSLDKDLRLYEE